MTVTKTLAAVCVLLLLAVSTVFAQGGVIMVFSDMQGVNCDLFDRAPGLCAYYVVHVATAGATASQWAAPQPACFMATYLSDTPWWPVVIGNSQTGISIGYGACLASPIHILTINFFCQGLTDDCCLYDVVPDPAAPQGEILVVDCGGNLTYGHGGTSVINPNGSCCCNCTPAYQSTWGKVKSLYIK
jgi:hypothetical protein